MATLKRVTFPLLLPALGNTWLWVAVHSMRDFSFPLVLVSYQNVVITSLLWALWEEANLTGLSALAILLILASVAFTAASRRIAAHSAY